MENIERNWRGNKEVNKRMLLLDGKYMNKFTCNQK